jgi:hypothetical protein
MMANKLVMLHNAISQQTFRILKEKKKKFRYQRPTWELNQQQESTVVRELILHWSNQQIKQKSSFLRL